MQHRIISLFVIILMLATPTVFAKKKVAEEPHGMFFLKQDVARAAFMTALNEFEKHITLYPGSVTDQYPTRIGVNRAANYMRGTWLKELGYNLIKQYLEDPSKVNELYKLLGEQWLVEQISAKPKVAAWVAFHLERAVLVIEEISSIKTPNYEFINSADSGSLLKKQYLLGIDIEQKQNQCKSEGNQADVKSSWKRLKEFCDFDISKDKEKKDEILAELSERGFTPLDYYITGVVMRQLNADQGRGNLLDEYMRILKSLQNALLLNEGSKKK